MVKLLRVFDSFFKFWLHLNIFRVFISGSLHHSWRDLSTVAKLRTAPRSRQLLRQKRQLIGPGISFGKSYSLAFYYIYRQSSYYSESSATKLEMFVTTSPPSDLQTYILYRHFWDNLAYFQNIFLNFFYFPSYFSEIISGKILSQLSGTAGTSNLSSNNNGLFGPRRTTTTRAPCYDYRRCRSG